MNYEFADKTGLSKQFHCAIYVHTLQLIDIIYLRILKLLAALKKIDITNNNEI